MSSFLGPEDGIIGNIRAGISLKNDATPDPRHSTSTSPSADGLSDCVVVKGKSIQVQVQGGSLFQPQPQKIEVPFNLAHHVAADNTDDLRNAVVGPLSFKRKRPQGGSRDSGSDSNNKNTKAADGSPQHNNFALKNISTTNNNANSLSDGSRGWNISPACNSSLTTVSFTSATTLGDGSLTSNLGVLSQVSSKLLPQQLEQPTKLNNNSPSPSLSSCSEGPHKKFPQSIMAKSPHAHHNPPITKGTKTEERRIERNQREKERSNKIAHQVDALRSLLQRGGLFIPKNTKSSVLCEASNYIRTLQDRHQLMSLEMEALKRQMVEAMAVKQQYDMNVNNMPPNNAPQMQGGPEGNNASAMRNENDQQGNNNNTQYYDLIFRSTMAGMAVASMGGALLECNAAFHDNTGLSPEEMNGMTIFNIVHPSDLPRALDLISHMIDSGYVASGNGNLDASAGNGAAAASLPPTDIDTSLEPVVLRSSFYSRPDLGLCVSLIRGDDNIAKCFSITLVMNASAPPASNAGMGNAGPSHLIPFNPSLPNLPSLAPQARKASSSIEDNSMKPG